MSIPAHKLSPSAFGRSFEFECDRQLKVALLSDEHTPEPWRALKEQGRVEMKTRAGTRAVLDAGRDWEEEALTRPDVRPRVVAPPPESGDERERLEGRRWSKDPAAEVSESLRVLREARPGQLLYQLKLSPPPSLYARLGLSPEQLELRANLPDLVQVLSEEELARERLGELPFKEWLAQPISPSPSGRVFRVIDLKRSAKVKVSHRVQVLYYALELEEVLRAEGIEGRVDLDLGGVWIGGEEGPTAARLDAVRPFFERRLSSLPALLAAPVEEARWRLQQQCEWCDLHAECAAQATREDHISRLQGVSARGLETLEALGARTVADLAPVLQRPQIDEDLSRCASLDKQTLVFRARVKAHVTRAPAPLDRLSQLLPAREEVAVFLTAHSEPGAQRAWGLGLMVVDRVGATQLPREPLALVAASAEELAPNLLRWFNALDRTLSAVAQLSAARPLSAQLYCYSNLERRLVLDALRALRDQAERAGDRDLWARAERLLYVIQGTELIGGERHPSALTESPIVSLLSALSGLYALPIDVTYTLPEVAEALALSAPYPRSEERHFPYGHQLRSDHVLDAWAGVSVDLEPTRQDLRARLAVYAELVDALRARRPEAVVRALRPFRLPQLSSFRHPDLSRLAYIARHERSSEQQGTRGMRFEGVTSAERYSLLPVLQSHGGGRFGVVALPLTLRVEVRGFAPWLLVEANDDGLARAAQVNDEPGEALPPRVERVKISELIRSPLNPAGVEAPQVGDVVTLEGGEWRPGGAPPAGLEVPAGRYLFLCPCHSDGNTEKSIKALGRISDALPPDGAPQAELARGPALLVSLLNGHAAAHNALDYPEPVAARLEASRGAARLTESQREAWARVARQRVGAIWGPPGTGKTHFLASYLLALAEAHRAERRSLRVVVSAMTNAAIDNLMAKIAELSSSLPAPPALIRAGKWTVGMKPALVEVIDNNRKLAELPTAGVQVVGATQWKLDALNSKIDLLVIDEASQLLISHACIGFSHLKESGRVLVAGDHEQLGPVLKGDYLREDPAERRLVGSILDLVRGATLDPKDQTRAGVPLCQLLENFRMCERLTELSRLVYGPRYRCATPAVAARRLELDVQGVALSAGLREAVYDAVKLPEEARAAPVFNDPRAFARECLSPNAALTLVVIDGAHAARENPREAALVALLALSLREAAAGRSDQDFWREELFVIGPHHRQNDLTRGALKAARGWSFNPFVETVDKAQGQESGCVLISYGVADEELAAAEGSFLYDRNRLNVSVTRAKGKAVLFLSRPLLDGSAQLLDDPEVVDGLGYMQHLERLCRDPARGREERFDLGGGASALVLSLR